jgi:hypothetical protein
MSKDQVWSNHEPFEIDGDELDGMSPQECFALGVEWQKYYQWCLDFESLRPLPHTMQLMNSANLNRLTGLLSKHNVPYRTRWATDDWIEVMLGENNPFPARNQGGDSEQPDA